ncbi:MAG: type II toxin-antitoxin system RelE/ParE family toxin [Clostridiales bacterium]|nr:type II toxin-antitoxin system RelE/ParE family toxin [Clostridiales bacterium]
MAYKLVVTEHADKLLDSILHYLIYQLKNEQAAIHLLDEMKNIYDHLEENPLQFPISRDTYLANKGYHEAVVGKMNYIIVFSIKADIVNIVGIFHR